MIEGLTYFVELSGSELLRLLERPGLLEGLRRSRAALAVAMSDLSPERSHALRELQAAAVPLTAWLTVEEEHGYWLCADNATRAAVRYREVRGWLQAAGVAVEAIGLDLEPPLEDSQALLAEPPRALLRQFRHRRSRRALAEARQLYLELLAKIRGHGYRIETYQFPIILDERRAGSTLLQRTLGLVDLPADREVVMLYESLLPDPVGELLVESYGPDCQAIGVGVSGGGVPFVLRAIGARRLQGARLVQALRRAGRYTQHLYVFSLEGCVENGSFTDLLEGSLTPAPPLPLLAYSARSLRGALSLALRTSRLFPGI